MRLRGVPYIPNYRCVFKKCWAMGGQKLKYLEKSSKVSPMEFTCVWCRKVFEGGWSNAEAEAEAERYFGVKNALSDPRMVVVCDECYQLMHPDAYPDLVREARNKLNHEV